MCAPFMRKLQWHYLRKREWRLGMDCNTRVNVKTGAWCVLVELRPDMICCRLMAGCWPHCLTVHANKLFRGHNMQTEFDEHDDRASRTRCLLVQTFARWNDADMQCACRNICMLFLWPVPVCVILSCASTALKCIRLIWIAISLEARVCARNGY